MSGYKSIESLLSDTNPRDTTISIIIITDTGLLTDKFDIFILFTPYDSDRSHVLYKFLPAYDHVIICFDAGNNFNVFPIVNINLDRFTDSLAFFNYIYKILVSFLNYRVNRKH